MKLSVLVGAYNSGHTIRQTLEAIKNSKDVDYELIVVDDASQDQTGNIAKHYTENVITNPKNIGCGPSRNVGFLKANGDILVNIDSDVLVDCDTLKKLHDLFEKDAQLSAATGMLSEIHPNNDFFSQYKNLYMNYIFSLLPENVCFLYGSFHAIRTVDFPGYSKKLLYTEDADIGQKLYKQGKKIVLFKEKPVIHLKKYNFISWIQNDFRIPYYWAGLFVRHKGWKFIGKAKTGYLHSPKEQLVSLLTVGLLMLTTGLSFLSDMKVFYIVLLTIWMLLNIKFLSFLAQKRGVLFFLKSIPITFLDHCVMLCGVIVGLLSYPARRKNIR